MTRSWGNTTDRILLLLAEREMTKLQICKALDLDHDDVSSVLTRLKRPSMKFGKRIYVYDYVREASGHRRYIRPVFAAGDKPNAKRPKAFTAQERGLAYSRNRIARLRSKSIFTLGMTNRELIKGGRA